MLKADRKEAVVIQYPATLPLERVLGRLAEVMVQWGVGNTSQHRNLRITLSGVYCPAVGFTAPVAVTRWNELRQIANATAAEVMGVDIDQIVCVHDAFRSGIAAAITVPLMAELQRWAAQHHCRITTVQPLWAVAMQSAAAKKRGIRGLLVQEPDAVTLLADDVKGRLNVLKLPGETDPDALQTHLRRWLVGAELSEDKILKLGFGTQPRTVMPQGPQVWDAHWRSL